MKPWKWLTGLFFLLVIVDGALRKWVFPSQSALLFVLKDVVLWSGFIVYALRRSPTELPRPLRRTWLPFLLGAYVYIVLLQAFNPRLPNLTVSLLGLKAHLAFIPLVILLPAMIAEATERQIVRTLWGYTLLLVLPLAALSVYQFFQPPSSWINQYVREMQTIATVDGHVRVISTFSYIGSHTAFLVFNSFVSTGVLFAGVRFQQRNLLLLGCLMFGATVVVLPMTGSRAPVIIVIGAISVLLAIAESRLSSSLRLAIFTLIIATATIQLTGLADGWEALAKRASKAGDTQHRVMGFVLGPIDGIERGGFLGYGVGSNHQAASRFVSKGFEYDWLPNGYVENFIARIVTELGVVGWLVLVSLKGVLVYLAYQTYRRARHPVGVIIGVTAFCLLLAKTPSPVVYNAVTNAFYWGTTGAMLGVWSLQQVRNQPQVTRRRHAAKGIAG